MRKNKLKRVQIICFSTLAIVMGLTTLSGNAAERLPDSKDYRINSVFKGPVAKTIDHSDEFTHLFRTRFTAAMKGNVVFAGEYAQAEWGCGGSGCHTVALINKRTGRALDKAFTVYYGGDDENPISVGEDIVFMAKDSRLLVTSGVDETTNTNFYYYYELKDDELKLIRKLEEKTDLNN